MSHDVRDEVIDFIRHWSERTELAAGHLVQWIGIGRSKYYQWRERYGKVNEHNAWIPRDFWLPARGQGRSGRRKRSWASTESTRGKAIGG